MDNLQPIQPFRPAIEPVANTRPPLRAADDRKRREERERRRREQSPEREDGEDEHGQHVDVSA
jgi:hypothetical protein